MREGAGWGAVIGASVAVVAWIGESRGGGVSLFPDLLSLIVFASLAAFVFGRLLRRADNWKQAIGTVIAFGVSAGLALGIATLQRGAMTWSRVSLPLAATTVLGSLFIVVLLSCSIGVLTFHTKSRRARASV